MIKKKEEGTVRLLVITECASDFSDVLQKWNKHTEVVRQEAVAEMDLSGYDAIALLGGVHAVPMILYANVRVRLERYLAAGGKVFSEYCSGIGETQMDRVADTRFERPVVLPGAQAVTALEEGIILDEQCNDRILMGRVGPKSQPLMQYVHCPRGFYRVDDPDAIVPEKSKYALWLDAENHMVCAFRMCNYARARFAPRRAWIDLICAVARYLGVEGCAEDVLRQMNAVYRLRCDEPASFDDVVREAMQWYSRADMLIYQGDRLYGAKESLSAKVHADGVQEVRNNPRPDMAGMTARAYELYGVYTGDERCIEKYRQLIDYPKSMQIQGGTFDGMIRWCAASWFASYPDDCVHGFLMPMLWHALLTGDTSDYDRIEKELDFVLKITGSDGLPPCRVDMRADDDEFISLMTVAWDEKRKKWHWGDKKGTMQDIRNEPMRTPSAHYVSFHLAAMLFYGLLTGKETYLEAGEKGLSALMSYYPNTAREHSETQELGRLLMPLSFLYMATEDPEKKQWLYRVAEDLRRLRHPKGGFMEWDTGYIACCAGAVDGESSVLAENGNPVVDMLYSSNWMAEGFAMAYFATGDPKFMDDWQDVANFLRRVQLISPLPTLQGAWTRAVDVDLMEVYGVPNDLAWAPWSIEPGWTMSMNVIGLLLGLMKDKMRALFQDKLLKEKTE